MAKLGPTEGHDSELVQKGLPCPGCSSSDGFALYSDGHGYCFVEAKSYPKGATGMTPELGPRAAALDDRKASKAPKEIEALLATSAIRAIPSRGLTGTTTKFWDYRTRTNGKGEKEQLAVYRDNKGSKVVAIKVRNTGQDGTAKGFHWVGQGTKVGLYGRWLWSSGGKKLVITEGEIDAQSASQVQDNKFPVVSVPHGAAEAAKAVAADLEWVSSFEEVILMFDMDGPGIEAANEVAQMLPPGKAKIAKLPDKDANELLKNGKGPEVVNAIWRAEPWRPEGYGDARELTTLCLNPVVRGLPWPWAFLTAWTYGRRAGEVVTTGAGTGIGKSDFGAEVVASTITGLTREGEVYPPAGFCVFGYESGQAPSKKQIAGKIARQRFHIPQGEGPEDGHWTTEQLEQVMADMDGPIWKNGGKLYIPQMASLRDPEAVFQRMRYMFHAEGIRHFLWDPISAAVVDAEDERKALDKLMMDAQLIAGELGLFINIASHLTRPDQGPSHEEGGQVRLKQFRGSNGIGMSSAFVMGLERNTQAEDELDRTKTLVRMVKDRYTGNSTGKTRVLFYDKLAGTLDEETLRVEGL